MDTLAPDVLGVRRRHVHIQVADVGLLRVGLETLSDPEGLGAPQERVWDKDEPWTQQESTGLYKLKENEPSIIYLVLLEHCGGRHTDVQNNTLLNDSLTYKVLI